jgi:hypothetical protein
VDGVEGMVRGDVDEGRGEERFADVVNEWFGWFLVSLVMVLGEGG